ncbi:MAG TPA: GWxTD domain-containing protein, partial [Thermoanaerobaculia bacterium]|nr:GWxTD domain-containing protein [Thermoanaerobaculia bacterium]
AAVLLSISLPLAAESPLEFGTGPARWLMTADETRAWKQVKTEEEAKAFADLFWVRRDPTPGTYTNEFRAEFAERVRTADERFKEGNKRGALTERGRVLITLGFPKSLGAEASKRSSQFSAGGALDPTGGRTMAAREVWSWERADALKFGMPKIDVVFIHDGLGESARRDPQRPDFTSALPRAIQYYIRNPELTAVPDWAKTATIAFESGEPAAAAPAAEPARTAVVESSTSTAVPIAAASAPNVAARPEGASKLTLVADAFAIQPQGGKDPFRNLSSLDVFKRSGELGWAAQYCTPQPSPTVEVTLRISGLINGEKVNFNAPAEEMVPDQIKAVPGCYLVRGAIPLADMDPGNYTLFVKIGNYNLTQQFRLEQ